MTAIARPLCLATLTLTLFGCGPGTNDPPAPNGAGSGQAGGGSGGDANLSAGGGSGGTNGGSSGAPSPPGGGSAGTSGPVACTGTESTVVITDDTNYSLPSTLTIGRSTVRDATDLVFDWSGLTRDLYGKPLNPLLDIDMILVSLWSMTPEELEENLEKDELPLSANKGAITTYPQDQFTSQNLTRFDLFGNPIPEEDLWGYFDTKHPKFQYPQDQYTFLLMASTGTATGKGVRMLSFFTLDPNATETTLTLTDTSTTLQYSVELEAARPVFVPPSTPGITLDWSQMQLNALGNEYVHSQITQAVVAHYATRTLTELETSFVDLETLADGWWSGEVKAGTSIQLGELVNASGAPFPGITDQGIWLVALFCTQCNNPAPWSITLLRPCVSG